MARFVGDASGFIAASRAAGRAAEDLGTASGRAAQAIGFAAVNMVGNKIRQGGQVLGGVLSSATREASMLESTIASLTAVMGSGFDADKFSVQVKKASAPLPTSALEMAQAAEQFARQGQRGADNLIALGTSAVNFARISKEPIEVVARRMSFLATQIKRPGESFREAANRGLEMATVIGQSLPGAEKEVLRASTRVAALAEAFGVSNEAALALAAGARAGTEQTLTAASNTGRIIAALNNPANFNAIDKALNRPLGTFAKEVSKDAEGALFGLLGRFDEMTRSGKIIGPQMIAMLKSISVGGARAQSAFVGLVKSNKQIQLAIQGTRTAIDNLAEGAETQLQAKTNRIMDTMAGKAMIARGTFQNFMSTLGQFIIIALKPMLDVLAVILEKLSAFAADHPVMTSVVLGFTALAFILLKVIGTLINFTANVGFATVSMQSMAAMSTTASTRVSLFGLVIGNVSSALGVMNKMLGLSGILGALKNVFRWFTFLAFHPIGLAIVAIGAAFAFAAVKGGFLGDIMEAFKPILDVLQEIGQELVNVLVPVFKTWMAVLKPIIAILVAVLIPVLKLFFTIFKAQVFLIEKLLRFVVLPIISAVAIAFALLANLVIDTINFSLLRPLGLFFKAINDVSAALPGIEGTSLPTDLTIGNIDVPDFPALATGGIVTKPTLALVGEQQDEAVIPLDRLRGGMGGGAGKVVIPVTVVLDGEEVGRALIKRTISGDDSGGLGGPQIQGGGIG